mmetsp:Transcript_16608/g.23574  ORF Transcript_16608/g.23574 Transcript_16608/m.23574 type:complete len:167 (-) Transcript_16608:4033-4533(-)
MSKKRNIAHNTLTVIWSVYTLKQQDQETVKQYYQRFKATVNTVDLMHANGFEHKCIVKDIQEANKKDGINKTDIEITTEAHKQYKAMIFLMNGNTRKYYEPWKKLEQNLSLGRDDYPKTVQGAYGILARHTPTDTPRPIRGFNSRNSTTGADSDPTARVSFAQANT